jgi:hypothetical protein
MVVFFGLRNNIQIILFRCETKTFSALVFQKGDEQKLNKKRSETSVYFLYACILGK